MVKIPSSYIVLGTILVGLALRTGLMLTLETSPAIEIPIQQEAEPPQKTEEKKTIVTRPPIGVMIENELNARPWQRGLGSADIVYEALTEGGITRFLAIFFDSKPIKVGPIRSVRPYFVDWISEYHGALAHVGGSDEALQLLGELVHSGVVTDINQYFDEAVFRRENIGKTALEHTMFSTIEQLATLVYSRWEWPLEDSPVWSAPDHLEKRFEKMQMKALPSLFDAHDNSLPSKLAAAKITINYGYRTFVVSYQYDAATNTYLRSQAGKSQIDHNTNEQIAVKNLLIQEVPTWSLNDDKGRLQIETGGRGAGKLFRNGTVQEITWKKDVDGIPYPPTVFLDAAGNEIELIEFPLWIQIVAPSTIVTVE